MRDDVDLTPVSDNESGSKECTIGVLHTPVRERSRQDEGVVPPPAVRTAELFRRTDHTFGVLLKLVRARVDLARFGPDTGPFTQGAEGEFTAGDGDQVGRDPDFLLPDVLVFGPVNFGDSVFQGRNGPLRREQDGQGRLDARDVGGFDGRSVHAREEGPSVDGLTLRVHEGVPFRVGLFGVEPSQGGTLVGGGVLDRDGNGFALLQRRGERDGQCGPEDRVLPLRRDREGEVLVILGEGASLDGEVRSVEDDLVDAAAAAAGSEVQGGLSSDDALAPVYGPIELQVGGFDVEVVALRCLLSSCGRWGGVGSVRLEGVRPGASGTHVDWGWNGGHVFDDARPSRAVA